MRGKKATLADSKEQIDNFIEALGLTGNVHLSCKSAGIPRNTAYAWRKRWETFAKQWEDALEDATDLLMGEARRRAMHEDSDRLLMFLLKAHRRDLFGDKVEVKSEGEIHIVFDNDWKKS